MDVGFSDREMATGDAQWQSEWEWMRWQTPLCFLITVSPAVAAVVHLLLQSSQSQSQSQSQSEGPPRRNNLLPASATWAPCLRGLPPLLIPAYRGGVAMGMSWLFYRMLLYRGLVQFFFYTQYCTDITDHMNISYSYSLFLILLDTDALLYRLHIRNCFVYLQIVSH
jgi:hypothetical protein